MLDLNSASPDDIAAAGVSPTLARAIALWQPYRCWEDLLMISEVDDTAVENLRKVGFEIVAPDTSNWAAPKQFKISGG